MERERNCARWSLAVWSRCYRISAAVAQPARDPLLGKKRLRLGLGKPTVGWGRVPRAGRVRRDEVEGSGGGREQTEELEEQEGRKQKINKSSGR